MPDEVIRVEDQFYILATSSRVDDRTRVLKEGDTFAIFDRYGDIRSFGLGEPGLYHEGTRFLSGLEVRFGRDRPLLLSSLVRDDNAMLAVDFANPDMSVDGQLVVPSDTVHLFRAAFLRAGVCYQRMRLRNFALRPTELALTVHFEADFADIFEVRGVVRARRGRPLEAEVTASGVVLGYEGLDGVVRRTRLEFSPPPARMTGSEAELHVRLEPRAEATFYLTVVCEAGGPPPRPCGYDGAFVEAGHAVAAARAEDAQVFTSNEQFNDWLNRSCADLHMMVTQTPDGPYPYAGVPWFSTVFGRDGIITALEYLWVNPALARGVLAFLASHQARETRPEQDAEPGKILHELRKGEMAALGEIPFGTYYGTVDATPLFVMLAGAYLERTGDRAFINAIWPNVEAALAWIDGPGDPDGDGFVEYARHSSRGLVNQGWKDSRDSVSHADGTLAVPPIALAEVQGYVYAARRAAAHLAARRGELERSQALLQQARELKARFTRAFWLPDLGTYALALDGAKRPCRVRTSNAGHLLYTGIAASEHAPALAATLLGTDMFSGWGVRTMSQADSGYNPIGYHVGTIWPHDNAIVAMGLAKAGFRDEANQIAMAQLEAAGFSEHRLPEAFAGFDRNLGRFPVPYPTACSPQAWATGAPFVFVKAMLGLDARDGKVTIDPHVPEIIGRLRIHGMHAFGTHWDVEATGTNGSVSLTS